MIKNHSNLSVREESSNQSQTTNSLFTDLLLTQMEITIILDDDDNIPDDADQVPLVQMLEVRQAQLVGVVAEVDCVYVPSHLLPETEIHEVFVQIPKA